MIYSHNNWYIKRGQAKASFCEQVLIDHDRSDEAYEKYGLTVPLYGVYNNIFRGICKKYPKKDKRAILLDLIEKTGNKSQWFAAAKTIGELNLALECARLSSPIVFRIEKISCA